jgi:hypothetical protein
MVGGGSAGPSRKPIVPSRAHQSLTARHPERVREAAPRLHDEGVSGRRVVRQSTQAATIISVTGLLVGSACTWGPQSVDRDEYVSKNLEAIAFLEHPSEERTVRHQAQREPRGHEEVVVAYSTTIEEARPPGFDPFAYFGGQFAQHGWSVGCIETTLEPGEIARSVSAANETSFARVEAGDAVMTVSVDHNGAHSGNGTAESQIWNCTIPPP